MSKERLEKIEERVLVDKVYYKYLDGTKGHWGKVYTLSKEDYNYLKEQAERVQELEKQNKRYREAIEYIQREIRKAIYTPKKQKWNSDFEREFESGKTRGLIQASDIVKEAIEILEDKE